MPKQSASTRKGARGRAPVSSLARREPQKPAAPAKTNGRGTGTSRSAAARPTARNGAGSDAAAAKSRPTRRKGRALLRAAEVRGTASSRRPIPASLRPDSIGDRSVRGLHGSLPNARRGRLDAPLEVLDSTRENVLAHERREIWPSSAFSVPNSGSTCVSWYGQYGCAHRACSARSRR